MSDYKVRFSHMRFGYSCRAMLRSSRFATFGMIAAVAALAVLSGCGDSGPQRYAVKGTVTLDGRPVNNATLIFTPSGPGLAAAATIREGAFELPADVGPTAGEFTVRINPLEAEIEETTETSHPPKANSRPKIPKIYQRDGALNAKITGEPNQSLTFLLKKQ